MAIQLFFSLKEIFVSFSCWHRFSFSLYFNKSLLTKKFQTSLALPTSGTAGQRPVDTVAGSPRDAPYIAWPSASHLAFCNWVNLLLGNFSVKRSLCNITHWWISLPGNCCLELGLLSTAYADTLCGLEEAMKSFTLTICLTGHIGSSLSPKMKGTGALVCQAVLLEEHGSRGSMCASSLYSSVVLDSIWDPGRHWKLKLWSGTRGRLTRQRERRHTFKGFSKM